MSSRLPPRYLPTLTEVVDPQTLLAVPTSASASASASFSAAVELSADVPPAAQTTDPDTPAPQVQTALPASVPPDKQALAQQLIKLVRPQLEAELRTIAQELFEAQFSALLPSMHLHIEEAVREAIEQALPDPPDILL
jgi:hypothetical protein